MENQLYLFLIFILTGFLIGILFDVFRIFRKSFKTTDTLTYIEDICFWILTTIIILYSIYKFNNGELRWFIFLGLFFGFSIYMLILSKIFINFNVLIIKQIKKVINFIFLVPILFIFNKLKKVIFKSISFLVINYKKNLSNFRNYFNRLAIKKKKNNLKKDLT